MWAILFFLYVDFLYMSITAWKAHFWAVSFLARFINFYHQKHDSLTVFSQVFFTPSLLKVRMYKCLFHPPSGYLLAAPLGIVACICICSGICMLKIIVFVYLCICLLHPTSGYLLPPWELLEGPTTALSQLLYSNWIFLYLFHYSKAQETMNCPNLHWWCFSDFEQLCLYTVA